MGRIFQFMSGVGLIILVIFVVFAILSITGHFQHEFTNPPS